MRPPCTPVYYTRRKNGQGQERIAAQGVAEGCTDPRGGTRESPAFSAMHCMRPPRAVVVHSVHAWREATCARAERRRSSGGGVQLVELHEGPASASASDMALTGCLTHGILSSAPWHRTTASSSLLASLRAYGASRPAGRATELTAMAASTTERALMNLRLTVASRRRWRSWQRWEEA
jgi:hypothetical protein